MPEHPLDCFAEGLWSMGLPGTWLPWAEVCTLAARSHRYWTEERCQDSAELLSGLGLVQLDPEPPEEPRRVRLVPGYAGALELSDSDGEAASSTVEEVGDTDSQTPSTASPAGASTSSQEWTASGRRWRSRVLTPPPGSWVLPQRPQVSQEELELLPTYFVLLQEAISYYHITLSCHIIMSYYHTILSYHIIITYYHIILSCHIIMF
jgi:hypothetical protein